MAAFNFPDPSVEQVVENPITGSIYSWKEPPGKWILQSNSGNITSSDLIWEGPTSPVGGNFKLWYNTETLELYFYYTDINENSAWVPTSTPITMLENLEEDVRVALEKSGVAVQAANANLRAIGLLDTALNEVENSLGKVTLQEVVDNGNIANKPIAIETERGVAVFSEQELRITHEDNPYIRLVDQSDGDALEITLNDDHGHINMSDQNDELHFKFGNVEQITFKGDGAADFKGRVTVERPSLGENTSFNVKGGIRNSNDEVVIGNMLRAYHDSSDLAKDSGVEYKGKIYNENNIVNKGYVDKAANENAADIEAIEGRLDDLERIRNTGRWRLIENISSPSDTEFSLMKQNGTIIRQWNEAVTLNISEVDNNGIRHDVASWGEGDKIEVIGDDLDQPAFAVYTLGASPGGARPGMKSIATCDLFGDIPVERLVYRVRRFADSAIDLDQADARYVNTSGDTMTGKLETTSKIWIRPDGKGANGKNNMLVVNQEAADGGSIARFQKDAQDVLKIEYDGNINVMNNRLTQVASPVSDTDGVNKKWALDQIAQTPSPYMWRYHVNVTEANIQPFEFSGPSNPKWNDGQKHTWYFHKKTLSHNDFAFYKVGYHRYFQMGRLQASFWFKSGDSEWKVKGMFYVRDIYWGTSTNSDIIKVVSHTDQDDGENNHWPSSFTDRSSYYLKIAGLM